MERLGMCLGRTVHRRPVLSRFSWPGRRSVFLSRRRGRLWCTGSCA